MKNILLVDDDTDHAEIVNFVLRSEGYSVSYARNGRDALNILEKQEQHISLILLDAHMPVCDAVEFRKLQLANNVKEETPILLMSASIDIAERAEQIGAKGFIEKPFEINAFLNYLKDFT